MFYVTDLDLLFKWICDVTFFFESYKTFLSCKLDLVCHLTALQCTWSLFRKSSTKFIVCWPNLTLFLCFLGFCSALRARYRFLGELFLKETYGETLLCWSLWRWVWSQQNRTVGAGQPRVPVLELSLCQEVGWEEACLPRLPPPSAPSPGCKRTSLTTVCIPALGVHSVLGWTHPTEVAV